LLSTFVGDLAPQQLRLEALKQAPRGPDRKCSKEFRERRRGDVERL